MSSKVSNKHKKKYPKRCIRDTSQIMKLDFTQIVWVSLKEPERQFKVTEMPLVIQTRYFCIKDLVSIKIVVMKL